MRRRALLGLLPIGLAGCSSLLQRPYVAQQNWAITVPIPANGGPRSRGKVLLVRSMVATPELLNRGLASVAADGTMATDFYERWAVPPADGVGAALRQFLAQSGLFKAVLAPGSLASPDLALEPDLLQLWTEPAKNRAVASISIVLLTTGALNARVLLQVTKTATAPIAGPGPEAAVNAQLAALAAVFDQIKTALTPFA